MLSVRHVVIFGKWHQNLMIDQSYQMYPFSILRGTCFLSGVAILGTLLHFCLLQPFPPACLSLMGSNSCFHCTVMSHSYFLVPHCSFPCTRASLCSPGGLSTHELLLISHGHCSPGPMLTQLWVGCPEISTLGEHILFCGYFGFAFLNFIPFSVPFISNFCGGRQKPF